MLNIKVDGLPFPSITYLPSWMCELWDEYFRRWKRYFKKIKIRLPEIKGRAKHVVLHEDCTLN